MAREPREPHLRGSAPTGEDRDLHPAWVIGFGGGIAALILVGVAICAILLGGLRGDLRKTYPRLPPIPEAHRPTEFPEPRLQVTPRLDMRDYREREELLLRSYGWSDREGGLAHIPIGRAIDLYAARGLSPAMTGPPGADQGTGADAGAPPGPADGGISDGGRP